MGGSSFGKGRGGSSSTSCENQIDIGWLLKDDDQHSVASMETTVVPHRMLQQSPVEPMEPVESVKSPIAAPAQPPAPLLQLPAPTPPTPLPPPPQSFASVASVASVAPMASPSVESPQVTATLWQSMPVNPVILQENIWSVMQRLLEPATRFLGSLALDFSFLAPRCVLVCVLQHHTCRCQGTNNTDVHVCVHAPYRVVTWQAQCVFSARGGKAAGARADQTNVRLGTCTCTHTHAHSTRTWAQACTQTRTHTHNDMRTRTWT